MGSVIKKYREDNLGLALEDRELFEDLHTKWSLKNLTQKFIDRLSHLRANQITKDDLTQKIKDLSAFHEQKQKEN